MSSTDIGEVPKAIPRASVAIAAFSTIVEWYDFTLYLYFATVLSRVFFGSSQALVIALAGFAAAYFLRPLGAIVFGHIGDRHGRRHTMLLSVAVMTMAMFGTALLPTHAQAGAIAGLLLFLLRCVMGFSVGGEYSVVVAYLLEAAPANRRGLDGLLGFRGQRSRRPAGGRRFLLDRPCDERGGFGRLGMAHPFSGRRHPGRQRMDRPLDHAGVAGL